MQDIDIDKEEDNSHYFSTIEPDLWNHTSTSKSKPNIMIWLKLDIMIEASKYDIQFIEMV